MKVGIIGLGMVGKEVLLKMFQLSAAREIVVYDLNKDKTRAEIYDLEDSIPLGHFNHYSHMSVADGYNDFEGCSFLFVNASVPAKNLSDRTSLLKANEKLMQEIAEGVMKVCPKAIVIITSNPVDAMTQFFIKYSGMPANQVIGSGDVLDTVRLRRYLANYYEVSDINVTSFVLGEHGNTSFVPWSLAQIAGVPLDTFGMIVGKPPVDRDVALDFVRQRGLMIYNTRGYTDHGIGASVYTIYSAIAQNERRIMPVSALLTGQYGIDNLVIGALCEVGANGIEQVLEYPLSADELKRYQASAAFLQQCMNELKASKI